MDNPNHYHPRRDSPSILLELAACDDLPAFTRAAADLNLPLDSPSPWYGRWWSQNSSDTFRFELRTPLMVAALYGSVSVVQHLLSDPSVDVNRRSGSDSATALHCAAAGGSSSALTVSKLLLSASADPCALDASGKTPADVLPRSSTRSRTALETLLRGGSISDLEKEDYLTAQTSPSSTAKADKKEYPVDATLPDIKSGIYGSDEFRMYTFKVKPCSRAYSHDWTECPFVHPGENARRRDPRKYHYSCVPCPDFRKGSCHNGDACEYAHGVFESWLHPAQYRTRLCKDETGCNRRVCFFAHKLEELRPLHTSTVTGAGSPVISSPRAGITLPPLDLGATAMLLSQPMSPSTSSALAAAVWLNQTGGVVTTPTAQLPSSRLKSGLMARDLDLELELMGLDSYKQQLVDEISGLSTLNSSWSSDMLLSPMKNLSVKPIVPQFQSPPSIQRQLLSGYAASNLPSSPSITRTSSPSSFDHTLTSTFMNSRASAFAKRSQSFIDRGASNARLSNGGLASVMPAMPPHSNWGSPDGKLDWAIQGEEINKLRKSASFAFRGNGYIPPAMTEEPDVSWVQSLVKDGPPAESRANKQYHLNGGADEFHAVGGDRFAAWAEQIQVEQEQMVA